MLIGYKNSSLFIDDDTLRVDEAGVWTESICCTWSAGLAGDDLALLFFRIVFDDDSAIDLAASGSFRGDEGCLVGHQGEAVGVPTDLILGEEGDLGRAGQIDAEDRMGISGQSLTSCPDTVGDAGIDDSGFIDDDAANRFCI